MERKYEPIGTIVKLLGKNKLIMICGYKFTNPNKGYEIEDYVGIEYPNGLSDINNKHLFSHEEIEKIIYNGFENEEYLELNNKLSGVIKQPVLSMNYLFDENGYVINSNKEEIISEKPISNNSKFNEIKDVNEPKYVFDNYGVLIKDNSKSLKFANDGTIIGY